MSQPTVVVMALHVRVSYNFPDLPTTLLFVDVAGSALQLPTMASGGHALVVEASDGAPRARRVELAPDAIGRIASAVDALGWPEPDLDDQADTSKQSLSLSLDAQVGIRGGHARVSVMAGTYGGNDADALRALLAVLLTELAIPPDIARELRLFRR